jgi:hypothetical protein
MPAAGRMTDRKFPSGLSWRVAVARSWRRSARPGAGLYRYVDPSADARGGSPSAVSTPSCRPHQWFKRAFIRIERLVRGKHSGLHFCRVVGLAAGQDEPNGIARRSDWSTNLGNQPRLAVVRSPGLFLHFWRRHYADGCARWCCRSSRVHHRRRRRDGEGPDPGSRISTSGRNAAGRSSSHRSAPGSHVTDVSTR